MDFSWPTEYNAVFFLTWPISFFSSIIFCVHLFVPRILAKLDYLLVPKYKVSFFLPGYASSCLWPCPINILFSHGTFKALIRGFLVYQVSLLSCDSQILVWIRITWEAGRRQMTQSHPQNFQFNRSGGWESLRTCPSNEFPGDMDTGSPEATLQELVLKAEMFLLTLTFWRLFPLPWTSFSCQA